jgi:hypothetical protein
MFFQAGDTSKPRHKSWPLTNLSKIGIVLFFALTVSCTTDANRIQDAQEAVDSGVITEQDRETGEISIFDIRDGDCFNDMLTKDLTGEQESSVYKVELVPCSGDWDFRVLDVFTSNQSGEFPSDAAWRDEADSRCPMEFDFFYTPGKESWDVGDKLITCMEEG